MTKPKSPTDGIAPFVQGIGRMVMGSSILLGLFLFFGEEFISMLLFVAMPVILVGVAFRFVSVGTLQLLFSGDLTKRVTTYIETQRDAMGVPTATHQADAGLYN